MNDRLPIDFALVVGRSLAFCAHPLTAWKVTSTTGRTLLVIAYFVAAFISTLGTLLAF
jgi:hypothetical protein